MPCKQTHVKTLSSCKQTHTQNATHTNSTTNQDTFIMHFQSSKAKTCLHANYGKPWHNHLANSTHKLKQTQPTTHSSCKDTKEKSEVKLRQSEDPTYELKVLVPMHAKTNLDIPHLHLLTMQIHVSKPRPRPSCPQDHVLGPPNLLFTTELHVQDPHFKIQRQVQEITLALGRTEGGSLDARVASLWPMVVKCQGRGAWAYGTCTESVWVREFPFFFSFLYVGSRKMGKASPGSFFPFVQPHNVSFSFFL